MLYQCCGTEDFIYADNQKFRKFIEPLKLPYTYEEGPGGHEWKYWDRQIERILEWLPLQGARPEPFQRLLPQMAD